MPDPVLQLALQPDPIRAKAAAAIFIALSAAGIAMVAALAVMITLRRRRRANQAQQRAAMKTTSLDPWAEAGRRLKAPDLEDDDLTDSQP